MAGTPQDGYGMKPMGSQNAIERYDSDPDRYDARRSKASSDEEDLARWGKKQQLKRNFRMLSIISLLCTLMITWESTTIVLGNTLRNGGPGGVVYGYIFVWIGTLLQTLVMAELGSMMPLAGGMYNWTAILAPKSSSKFLSYAVGWLSITAYQSGLAGATFLGGQLVQGLAAVTNPGYIPTRWQGTLLLYAVLCFGVITNTILVRVLPHIESAIFVIHVVGFFAILIPLVYFADHGSAGDVFASFLNLGGWQTQGLSWFVGLTPLMFAFVGTDAGCHMAEEIHNAKFVIPWSMVSSVGINGTLGFAMLLALLFCIGDVEAVLATPTGVPFIQIYLNATESIGGTAAMASILAAAQIMCGVGILAAASRLLWAFAREDGLPFSKQLKRVQPSLALPLISITTSVLLSCLLGLINIGSTEAFSALTSTTIAGLYSSFAITSIVYLIRLRQPGPKLRYGPFQLGRARVPVIIAALVYTTIGFFFSFWPPAINPTAVTMNWVSAMFGGVVIFATVFWFAYSRHHYHGPVMELSIEDVVD